MEKQKGVSSLSGTIILSLVLAIIGAVLIYNSSLIENKNKLPEIKGRDFAAPKK